MSTSGKDSEKKTKFPQERELILSVWEIPLPGKLVIDKSIKIRYRLTVEYLKLNNKNMRKVFLLISTFKIRQNI